MKRVWIFTALAVGLLLAGLVGVLLYRTFTTASHQVRFEPAEPLVIDLEAAAGRLASVVRLETISEQDDRARHAEAFTSFQAVITAAFPRVHATLERELVGAHSLLYTWRGSDTSLPPVLLLAHIDVVPVEAATLDQWTHPPFAGVIDDGYVWGRGTMDDKGSLMGILEAAEALLTAGFTPRRTVYLAFGHDEEIGGRAGAVELAALLERRGVHAWFALDEGLAITEGIMPGLDAPAALVGIAEKGYVTLEIVAKGRGGHSSMPPEWTAAGRVARAITRLEDNPMPAEISEPVRAMFTWLAPEMPFGQRLAFTNLWLLGGTVIGQMSDKPTTNALIRTTTAPTMLAAGTKENVLPKTARAVVNFRIRPGETMDDVVAHAVQVTNDDPEDPVEVTVLEGLAGNPSPISCVECEAFAAIHRALGEVASEVVVAPGLMVGASDGRHYAGVAENVYRFVAMRLRPGDPDRIHGVDERVAVDNYGEMIRFYAQLLRNL